MMEDMRMQAKGKSLGNLIGAMEEDDAKSIPSLTLKITSGQEGIEVEKIAGEGEVEGDKESETEKEMDNGMEENSPYPKEDGEEGSPDAFAMLIAKKKKEKQGY